MKRITRLLIIFVLFFTFWLALVLKWIPLSFSYKFEYLIRVVVFKFSFSSLSLWLLFQFSIFLMFKKLFEVACFGICKFLLLFSWCDRLSFDDFSWMSTWSQTPRTGLKRQVLFCFVTKLNELSLLLDQGTWRSQTRSTNKRN